MRPRIIVQIPPWHWAPDGKLHRPRRCPFCLLCRIAMRLGITDVEDD